MHRLTTRQRSEASRRADEREGSSRGAATPSHLSLVVPTLNEAANIDALVARLERVLPPGTEVIFVDDSDDETPAVIRSLIDRSPLTLRLYHRAPGQRYGGLGGAVVTGLCAATTPWACVLDADLQHPPELIPQLVEQCARTGADIAVASRYRSTGPAAGAPNGVRSVLSRVLVLLTRLLFWPRLRDVTDPLSGFFVVRIDRVECERLRPRGFKILLEILVRHPELCVTEVGFRLEPRHAGRSKASVREGIRYLVHILALQQARMRRPARLARRSAGTHSDVDGRETPRPLDRG